MYASTSPRLEKRRPRVIEPFIRMSAPQGMNAPTSFSTRRRIGALRLAARNIPISPPMEVPTQSIMGGGGPPRSRSSQVPAAGAVTRASIAAASAR